MDRIVTALTLRAYPLKEADKLLILLSREEGLKRVVAKGLRKAKSKIGGRLEPFRENRVQLLAGRSMDVVMQVEGLRAFSAIQTDFELLAAAMAACELLSVFLEEGEAVEDVYDLFVEFLALLKPGAPAQTLLAAFELHLMDLLGYRPELDACLCCAAPLDDARQVLGLAVREGGMVCRACEGEDVGRVLRLPVGAWEMLRGLQQLPLAECLALEGPPALLSGCRHAMKAYVGARCERELKAQGMFDWQGAVT